MPEVNPIADGYNALWAMYASVADFTALFPDNTVHQVRYTTTLTNAPDPDPNEIPPAHYPLCRIVVRRAGPATQRASGKSFLQVVYGTEICTGEQYQSVAFAACWAVYKAHLKWRDYVKNVVAWNSKYCVFDVDARSIEFDDSNAARNRGTKQWIPVWETILNFHFDDMDLQTL